MNRILDGIKDYVIDTVRKTNCPVYYLMNTAKNAALIIMSLLSMISGKLVISEIYKYTGSSLEDILYIFKENHIIGVIVKLVITWAIVDLWFYVIHTKLNPDPFESEDNDKKATVLFWTLRDCIRLVFLLYYCGYAINAVLSYLKNGIISDEQMMVGVISLIVLIVIVFSYYHRLNESFVRKRNTCKSDYFDANGKVLCLDDTVSWCGRKYRVSIYNDEWCLIGKSNRRPFLDTITLNEVVGKDLNHLFLVE